MKNEKKPFETIVKEVRKALKKEFPNCKFSVLKSYSTHKPKIDIFLLSANFQVFNDDLHQGYRQLHGDISTYPDLTQKAIAVLERAKEIANKDNYDKSDNLTDLCDTAYFLFMSVGKSDKRFKVVH